MTAAMPYILPRKPSLDLLFLPYQFVLLLIQLISLFAECFHVFQEKSYKETPGFRYAPSGLWQPPLINKHKNTRKNINALPGFFYLPLSPCHSQQRCSFAGFALYSSIKIRWRMQALSSVLLFHYARLIAIAQITR